LLVVLPENGESPPGRCAVKIEIFDQTYNVQADGDETYLRELAAFVDEKMRTVAEATRQVDSMRVAVLSALNIADELFTMRKRQHELEGPLRQRVEKCVNLVEKALENSH
jgi:cell division protein ZapA